MANKYFTLVTKLGQAKLANASVTGEKLAFSKIALGSGEGTPNESQTALQSEKWRGPVSNVAIDESNPNWVVIEAVIPHNAGGFTIAEIGVFDEAGDLVVVGNYPKTYKPVVEEGTTKDVAIRIIIEVSNAENVTFKVDPSVVIATRKYVDDAIDKAVGGIDFTEINTHISSTNNPHKVTKAQVGLSAVDNAKQATKTEFDAHVKDAVKHVTAAERTAWNGKETPDGAQAKVDAHAKDTNNPHKVNKAQVGLGNVDNAKQATKTEFDAHANIFGSDQNSGHVKLTNAVNSSSSVSDGVAATPRAVKEAYDKAVSVGDRGKSHEAKTVYNADGVHGLRVHDGVLQGLDPDTGEWGDVDAGGGVKVPLDAVSDLAAKAGSKRVELTWSDPADVTLEGVALTTWDKTVLVRKEGGQPTSINDGVKVVESSVRNQYKTTPYVDTAVQNEKIYYYRAFAVSTNKLVSDEGANAVQAQPMPYVLYGFEIDEANADPFGAVKYIEESTDFTPLSSGDGTVKYGSWADKFPLNRLKVVLLKDGKVVHELNKNDYRKTTSGGTVDITSGNAGDVMIAIPLTYWKFNRVGTKLRVYVSDGQPDEDFKAYAHSRNGVVQDDYLYVGAFKGTVASGKLRSLHDTMSTGDVTIGGFRTNAEANGAGYGQMNWATMTLLQIYSVLLTKSLDSQTALGRGYTTSNSSYLKNGATVASGLFYGEKTGKKQLKFLGLEDFYGNRYEWVDGFATSSSRDILINDKNVNYNDAGDGYTKHGKCFSSDGYIKGVEGTTGMGFIPKVTSGASTSTYYCDYAYQSPTGGRVAYFGGDRSSSGVGANAGTFCFYAVYAPSDSVENRGARCLFLKNK